MKMSRFVLASAFALGIISSAAAQPSPPSVTQTGTVAANNLTVWSANRQIKDGGTRAQFLSGITNCTIWGAFPFIGASGNIECLDPTGANGKFLRSNDAGANPSFDTAAGAGTVTSLEGTSSGSSIVITPTSGTNPVTAAAVWNFDLAQVANNRLLCNISGGAAIPTACSAANLSTLIGALTNDLSGSTLAAPVIANDAVTTAKILNANVTYAKIQNVANSRLLGNNSGGAAAPSEITVGNGVEFNASAIRRSALTGDATAAAGSNTTVVGAVNGVAYSSGPATDTTPVITAANTATYKALPDCDATDAALRYDTTAHDFSCASNVVTGPGTVVANNFAGFNGTSGDVVQDSGIAPPTVSNCTPTVTLAGAGTVPTYTAATLCRAYRFYSRMQVDLVLSNSAGGTAGSGATQIQIALPVAASASSGLGQIPVGTFTNGATRGIVLGSILPSGTIISLAYLNTISTVALITGGDQNNAVRNIQLSFSYEITP